MPQIPDESGSCGISLFIYITTHFLKQIINDTTVQPEPEARNRRHSRNLPQIPDESGSCGISLFIYITTHFLKQIINDTTVQPEPEARNRRHSRNLLLPLTYSLPVHSSARWNLHFPFHLQGPLPRSLRSPIHGSLPRRQLAGIYISLSIYKARCPDLSVRPYMVLFLAYIHYVYHSAILMLWHNLNTEFCAAVVVEVSYFL